MLLVEGKSRQFVTQVQPETSFPGLRLDYDRLSMALALAELYTAVTHPGQVDPDLFDLLVESLRQLERHPSPRAALVWAELKLMDAEGVHPDWLHCVHTGVQVRETPAWLSPSAGGYLSPIEAIQARDRFQAPIEVLAGLQKTSELSEPPPRLKLDAACLAVLHRFWLHLSHTALPGHTAMIEALAQE
jgi:DNA repair protein RecO